MHFLRLDIRTAIAAGLVFLCVAQAEGQQARRKSDGSSPKAKSGGNSGVKQLGPREILSAEPEKPEKSEPPPAPKPPEPKKEEPKKEEPQTPANQQQQPQQQQPAQTSPRPTWESSDEREYYEGSGKGSYVGVGNCSCSGLKAIPEAYDELNQYVIAQKSCLERLSKNLDGADASMAINDYSHGTGCMYIISPKGDCKYALNADFGTGSSRGQGSPPQAKCGGGSLGTPSGFHITGVHNGARYGPDESLAMLDIQGQGSQGRAILIHEGNNAGGAGTWGCTGVSKSAKDEKPEDARLTGFQIAKKYLPPGSLVFNYFSKDSRCANVDQNACMSPGRGAGGSSGRGSRSPVTNAQ